MNEYRLHPRLTDSRRAWLMQLLDGPARRGHSPTGFQCMRLGWTEWVVEHRDGRRAGLREVEAMFDPATPGVWSRSGEAGWSITNDEMLTESGHAILAGPRP